MEQVFLDYYWVAVGEPSHQMRTVLSPTSKNKKAKLRNRYPKGIVCTLRFRTIEESILGRLEAFCIASDFRMETSGPLTL